MKGPKQMTCMSDKDLLDEAHITIELLEARCGLLERHIADTDVVSKLSLRGDLLDLLSAYDILASAAPEVRPIFQRAMENSLIRLALQIGGSDLAEHTAGKLRWKAKKI